MGIIVNKGNKVRFSNGDGRTDVGRVKDHGTAAELRCRGAGHLRWMGRSEPADTTFVVVENERMTTQIPLHMVQEVL